MFIGYGPDILCAQTGKTGKGFPALTQTAPVIISIPFVAVAVSQEVIGPFNSVVAAEN